MFFQITAAGTAPSINYSTEKYRDWQKLLWFLVFYISIWGVEILFGGVQPWILGPLLQRSAPTGGYVWRAVDTALVPDIEGIQNKGIYLLIVTTCSVNVASTCSAGLYYISRRKPSRGAPNLKYLGARKWKFATVHNQTVNKRSIHQSEKRSIHQLINSCRDKHHATFTLILNFIRHQVLQAQTNVVFKAVECCK